MEERPKKERDDDSHEYKCEYYRGMEESRQEKEEDKKGKEGKKKSEGERFTPRMTWRKFARDRSALATRFIMRSRKRVYTYVHRARFRKSGPRQIVLRDKF